MGFRVTGFEWDEANVAHIARHQVTPEECEEMFADRHLFAKALDSKYNALGRTLAGRLLSIFFVIKPGRLVRVITAREMEHHERRRYRRQGT
ncbi:MAG: BrnT family toxin [Deinococcus sp.]|nr:BrnT family toxin [Deinococcus sp.]